MTEPASPSQLLNLSTELAAVVAQATPSVVAVLSHRSRSTGFVWRPGLIITADEALAEEGEFAVQPPGGDEISAQLLGRDPSTDIALLRVNHSDMQPVTTAAAPTRHRTAPTPVTAAQSLSGCSRTCRLARTGR